MDIFDARRKELTLLCFLLPLPQDRGLAPTGTLAHSPLPSAPRYSVPTPLRPRPRNTSTMSRVQVFVSSISSSNHIRSQHERVARYLAAGKVVFTQYDLASDSEAKSLWQRKNKGNTQLPFILVDGEPVGVSRPLESPSFPTTRS